MKRLLVLDADKQSVEFIQQILEPTGFSVLLGESGHQALETLAKDHFDLVIVGENLTDIDGVGFISKLRQQSRQLKIVYLTSVWRNAEFYQQMLKEFRVSFIAHRPLKSTIFCSQVASLFLSSKEPPPGIISALMSGRISDSESVALPVPIDSPVPNSMSNKAVEDAVEAFKAKFAASLPGRLKSLTDLLTLIDRESLDLVLLSEARRLAHNLKGTAKSSSFDKIGTYAENLENNLESLLETSLETSPEMQLSSLWHLVDEALRQLYFEAELPYTQFDSQAKEKLRQATAKSASAYILFVSKGAVPSLGPLSKGDVPIELIVVDEAGPALTAAQSKVLDAAVLDLRSEDKEATYALARQLRSLPGYDNLPLAFISESDKSVYRAEAAHAGASLTISGPFDQNSTQRALQHLISIRQGGRPRVLVLDDDADFCDLLALALGKEGILVRTISDPAKIEVALEEFSPDLLLLDVLMPGITGYDLSRKLRRTAKFADLPIIFLTAQTDLEARIAAYDAGGDDYLPKPVANQELLTRVKVRLDRSRLLKERTDRDVLTGLLLRRAFSDQVQSLISECQRHDFQFSLGLMDVDCFKHVNDKYGHLAGDRVLAYLGRLLRQRFRVEDVRGRWGGEEFILAFKHEAKETMQNALKRVLDELKSVEFRADDDTAFSVTFSAGMAEFPGDGKNFQDLLAVADKRLYKAKENGRKQILIES